MKKLFTIAALAALLTLSPVNPIASGDAVAVGTPFGGINHRLTDTVNTLSRIGTPGTTSCVCVATGNGLRTLETAPSSEALTLEEECDAFQEANSEDFQFCYPS